MGLFFSIDPRFVQFTCQERFCHLPKPIFYHLKFYKFAVYKKLIEFYKNTCKNRGVSCFDAIGIIVVS